MSCCQAVVVHACNPNTPKAEAGKSPWDQGWPGLKREFQDSQVYTQRDPVWKQTNKKNVMLSQTSLFQKAKYFDVSKYLKQLDPRDRSRSGVQRLLGKSENLIGLSTEFQSCKMKGSKDRQWGHQYNSVWVCSALGGVKIMNFIFLKLIGLNKHD